MQTNRRSFLFGLGALTFSLAAPITGQFQQVIAAPVNEATFTSFDADAFKYFMKKPTELVGYTHYTEIDDEIAIKEYDIIKQMIGDLIKNEDTPSFLDIFYEDRETQDYAAYMKKTYDNLWTWDYFRNDLTNKNYVFV